MKFSVALSGEKSRKVFLLFFLISSLLPLLVLLLIIYKYVFPLLSLYQIMQLKDIFTYGLLVILSIPLLGFFIMSKWIGRFEALTNEIKSKSIEIISGKKEVDEKPSINEIVALEDTFNELHSELQEKMTQLNDYSQKLLDTNRKVSKLAITDELTSLYNRRHFNRRITDEIDRHKRYAHGLALLMIDVDNFKEFNDKNGHQEGDKLLRVLGQMMQKSIRKTDSAFRYGGDEFAILLPECGKENAEYIARKLANAVSDYPFRGREKLAAGKITISIGVAVYSEKTDDFFKDADNLLFEAKRAGNGKVMT